MAEAMWKVGEGGNGETKTPCDFDLSEIDDKEYDIPTVSEEPILEDILNTPDDVLPELDYAFHIATLPQQGVVDDERESVSSQESSFSERSGAQTYDRGHRTQHYAIVRHIVMKKISHQLLSAIDRLDAGSPTALAVSSQIAIGTTNGLVLVFGAGQVLKWCLGGTAVGAQYGPVSSLSFNIDCSRLLCAYAKGQIMMWDLTTGRSLRSICDARLPNAGVVHIRFTDDRTLALSCDTRGSVFELKFRHLIGVRTCDSQCLFSGTRGEVCVIEPLRLQNALPDIINKELQIVAMASMNRALVVTIRPELKVHFVHRLHGDPSSVPVLAWQGIFVRSAGYITPALAIAKDQNIKIVQVLCQEMSNIRVLDFQEHQLSYRVLQLSWINPNTVIAIDVNDIAHVLDVLSGEELELIDLKEAELVFDVNFSNQSEENGDVRRFCYQSVVTCDGQLFVLGSKGIHVLTLRSWTERLNLLVQHGFYEAALDLAVSFYNGTAKAVLGLQGTRQKRREMVAERVVLLLESFLNLAMTQLCPSHGKLEELEAHYQSTVSICVDHCLHIGRLDILFGKVYERFAVDVIAKGVFLDCLEPYILKDELTHLTPLVMKDLLRHYENKGMLSIVEACIVHLDITDLDTKEIITHCWEHELYDALLYIYNQGLHDYVTPLERLIERLVATVAMENQDLRKIIQLGNKILVYISCCLCGRAYPLGDILPDFVAPVRNGVFACLSAAREKDGEGLQADFPHLRALINFDAREFFNVLELAFEVDGLELEKKQQLVDRILLLMVEDRRFTPAQFGALFTFLARQMARKEKSIAVDQVLFGQVLESLCASREDSRHEERQQALLELLDSDHLRHFERNRLISLAQSAHFFRVCEVLYSHSRDFDLILQCYWDDTSRQKETFKYIQNGLSGTELTSVEKNRIRAKALDNIERLVMIDSSESAKLVLKGYIGSLCCAVKRLFSRENEFFAFVYDIFHFHDDNPEDIDAIVKELDSEPAILEMYIELMCRKLPEEVLGFLKSVEGYRLEETLDICRRYEMTDGLVYLLEKSGDVAGAFELLMQKLELRLQGVGVGGGDISGAEEDNRIIVQFLQRNSFKVALSQRESLWFSHLKAIMMTQERLRLSLKRLVRHLCEGPNAKNPGKIGEEAGGEHLYPNGINAKLISPEPQVVATTVDRLSENLALASLNKMMNHVIDAMMTYFPLQVILQRVLNDPAYISGTFGEMKDLLIGMLDSSTYEKALIQTCAILVNKNIHDQLKALVGTATHGIEPTADVCSLCSKTLATISDKEMVICFQCGHPYHYVCLAEASSTMESSQGGERKWKCTLCDRHHRPGQVRYRRTSESVTATSQNSAVKPAQALAFRSVRQILRSPSHLQMLLELKKQDHSSRRRGVHNERFALRVAAPPP